MFVATRKSLETEKPVTCSPLGTESTRGVITIDNGATQYRPTREARKTSVPLAGVPRASAQLRHWTDGRTNNQRTQENNKHESREQWSLERLRRDADRPACTCRHIFRAWGMPVVSIHSPRHWGHRVSARWPHECRWRWRGQQTSAATTARSVRLLQLSIPDASAYNEEGGNNVACRPPRSGGDAAATASSSDSVP